MMGFPPDQTALLGPHARLGRVKHRTQVLKITVYEAFCEDCDWMETRAAGDADAGSDRQARLNAIRAAAAHRRMDHRRDG